MTQTLIHRGLGASEIAAVAGLHPYASPWDVWLAKTGQSEFRGNERTEWGQRLEPAIRQKYSDVTGRRIIVPTTSLFCPVRQWMRATPDGMFFDSDAPDDELRARVGTHAPDRLFQAKNTGEWSGKDWDAAPPEHVQLQEQWEMAVTLAPVADVCVLVGGNDWRMFSVERNDTMIADLVEIGAEFMRRVERGIPPDVDHSAACKEHLVTQMRKAKAIEFHADAETEAAIVEWRRLHIEAKEIEKSLEKARNVVRRAFSVAQCELVKWSGGVLRIQEPRTASTVDYEAVARLVASAKGMTAAEFDALVTSNTSTKAIGPVLAAPANWKDSK